MVALTTILDLHAPPDELTAALVNIPSVSRAEQQIADAVEEALRRQCGHLEILRDGNTVLARTNLGRPERVLLAGHLDTVPIADNLPAVVENGMIRGCGSTDMKSGDAVFLHVLATTDNPRHDITLVLYDKEELPPADNGIGHLISTYPDWLHGTAAILGEPTDGMIEAGCQGILWARVSIAGVRAHSARGWLGSNAIHRSAPVIQRIADEPRREVVIDGCTFREGLEVVDIAGGSALNVVPDLASFVVNFRFAPDRTVEQAAQHLTDVLTGLDVEIEILNAEPGARPGKRSQLLDDLTTAAGGTVTGKLGWTDVSRFAALGIAAVNLGPGDPNLAHTREEYVRVDRIQSVTEILRQLLSDAEVENGSGHSV